MLRVALAGMLVSCATHDATISITATVGDTRVITREHMLAAGEMQISGEPLAEAMGRRLTSYSRFRLPADVYFDPQQSVSWIDVAGFSTAIESYEYSKQAMNNLMFESGAGTSLAYGPLVGSEPALAAMIQRFARGANTLGRFVFPDSGWPGMWPTNHVFASFDPAIDPTSHSSGTCVITSDDNPGATPGVNVTSTDYECDATSLHLRDRATQIDPTITPGADGFSAWKYGLWVLNYLQIMHDTLERPVATVAAEELAAVGSAHNTVRGADARGILRRPGTYLGSSDIEGFQAQMFIASIDNRADDWLLHLNTADGSTLSGFARVGDAIAYGYDSPLRWFPSVHVTETAGGAFPRPTYSLASAGTELLDGIGLAMGYAEFYALTDRTNVAVGASDPARAMFDGDPFASDGEGSLHDRALAMMRVALIDLDRLHVDPATRVLVDTVTFSGATPERGHTLSTTSLAYALIGLRTALRSLGGQLELYSNNQPDTAISHTPLDAVALHFPGDPALTFSARFEQLLRTHAELLYAQLTDASGRAWSGWDVARRARIDDSDTLDAHAAAVRGLFAAYLATGDTRYRTRAIAVFDRMDAVFFDRDARIYTALPAPADSVEYTPLRFALVQSALRDMYELVARRPGNAARVPVLEDRIARLNTLVLDGWDDRDQNRIVAYPAECVRVAGGIPRGGLQAAERTLTGETGGSSDRDHDCVPEIDDAHAPAGLVNSITFHVVRP
ncbi:MAG TPA: hypothetical protein VGG28_01300 [Kofleriaceae bacterium]|jgi:hypothetical protein